MNTSSPYLPKSLQTISYRDKHYLVGFPVKSLFHSTMIHAITSRGDKFGFCLEDNSITVLPASACNSAEEFKLSAAVKPKPVQLELKLKYNK